jgi:outer membrane translocation and assembly module TamA
LMIRVNPVEHFSVAAGPFFQYFDMKRSDNGDRLIAFPSLNGLDSATLYRKKMYAGLQLVTTIDTRDNKVIPGRGINWQSSFRINNGMQNYTTDFSQLNSDLSLFMSFYEPAIFVIAQRIGAGINFGKYEFFQAQFLSGTENLRGFRKYRFAGDKILFSNTELRIKLTDLNTYILPSALGILGFFDAGRVWVRNESSTKLHTGYGAGVWLSPLKKFVVTGSYTISSEGGLPLISFGFQF